MVTNVYLYLHYQTNIMKNKTNSLANNLKMDNKTYILRSKVMQYVYEAKDTLRSKGIRMPRVDIRITEVTREFLGLARLNDHIIWIPKNVLEDSKWDGHLREIVFHELVHALTGFRHDENCPLMKSGISSYFPAMKADKAKTWFLKYFI